ncbi:MAG: TonB-dependent siderophore receptor [Rhodospirillales bacterium]|nr:TonB-dependent siderophore receptor [Rhodospirillales bacterium]
MASLTALPSMRTPWAQEPTAPSQLSQMGERDFDIPTQGLSEALILFGRQSGLQVSVEVNVVRAARSPGVKGRMTSEQALAALLSGTGLVYRVSGSMVAVESPQSRATGTIQLDPVQVQGYPVPRQAMIDNLPPPYAGGQVGTGSQLGLLGNRGVMDTPFNQTSYTAKKAQDQQATTIRDVLLDDPSVRQARVDGGAIDDSVFIRGFQVSPSAYSYGGVYGMLPILSPMMELAERVEVLKGPSVMLNGMPPFGSIGGTVNIVPKRAPDEDLNQVTATYISPGQVGGHVDAARRFGDDRQFGVRANGVFRSGQTEVSYNSDQRALAVLGLDFRGERVRLAADLGYQYQYIGGLVGYLGVANNIPVPWAPDARTNQGQPWNFQDRKDAFGVIRGEFDITERITAYAAFGAHDYRMAGMYTFGNTVTNFNGGATAFAPFAISQYNSYLTGQAGLRALVDTGPIGHEFAVNASTVQLDSGTVNVFGTAFATNIYGPTLMPQPNLATPPWTRTATQGLSSLAIADTLSAADKRIQLTAGVRLQQVTAANYNPTTGAQTSYYDQSATSPSVALVFKPWENVSVYGNWIQGLQQGIIVPANFTNAGEVFPPFKSTQYEVGVKVDWGKFTTTASLFQISQPSVLTNTANNTQFLGGEQRNQGLELEVFGEPLPGVRVLGGMMFLNPILTKTQAGATDGWIAPFSPLFNLNLSGEWDLPFVRGLTAVGRVLYTSSQYIDTTWPRRSLPDWTRFDVGLRYAFDNPGAKGKLLVARLNVENVLDTDYWAGGVNATALFLGQPRTFRLSLTADF